MTSPLDLLKDSSTTFDEAIIALRSNAKWFIAAIAAAATLIFGTAIITAPPALNWSEHPVQLTLAALCGLVGVSATVFVITRVAKVYEPVTVSLTDLPIEVMNHFAADPRAYFGSDATTAPPLDQLNFARAVVALRRQEWGLAVRSSIEKPADPAAKIALDAATGFLAGARENEAQFVAGAKLLLDEGRYYRVAATRRLTTSAGVAAVCAIFFGLLFQLTLSAAKADDEKAAVAAPTSVPVASVITLARGENGSASERLWTAAGLGPCRTSVAGQSPPEDATSTVLLVVLSGSGTPDSPYLVQTLPETAGSGPLIPHVDGESTSAAAAGGCQLVQFALIDDVAPVRPVPSTVVVSYAPITVDPSNAADPSNTGDPSKTAGAAPTTGG